MNFKLLRDDYYNADYELNDQEIKEFIMPLKEPYWVAKTRAFILDIPVFGQKSSITQNIEILLFSKNNIDKEMPSSSDVRMNTSVDFYEKMYGKSEEKSQIKILVEKNFSENKQLIEMIENLPGFSKEILPIYSYIPELKKMKKNLSSYETYCCLTKFSDLKMMFINMFKKNLSDNIISPIIYIPFTPHVLENCSNVFIRSFANYLNLHCKYTCQEVEEVKILKQKLLDIFYLVDDSEELHGITDCQSVFKECPNIASFYCENYMCKLCCQKASNKEFCIIHDELVNFFRKKMQDLLEFEQRKGFDRSITVRISIRQRISQKELEEMFQEYDIVWENTQLLFRKGVEKIQFIYLQCRNNTEAKRLYDDRSKLIKNNEKNEISINSILEPLEDILSKVESIKSSGLLVVPSSSLVKAKTIPKKSLRNRKFVELIEKSLEIDRSEFKISNCTNLINKDYSYDYYIVQFKEKEVCDRFFNLQPFFESIIFHKLSHLKLFPLMRHPQFSSKCLVCENEKNLNCVYELCGDCCSIQSNDHPVLKKLKCKCSAPQEEEKKNKRSMLICNSIIKIEEYCENCWRTKNKNCLNKMCDTCCLLQCYKKNCSIHQLSYYSNQINKNDFHTFVKNYQLKFSRIKVKINDCLKSGEFSWFRPIADTNVTRKMLDMNRELQIVMDNQNYKRDGSLRINDKMYKLYTFQNENYIKKNYGDFTTSEGIDLGGEFFVDYNFTKNNQYYSSSLEEQMNNYYIPSAKEHLSIIENSQYEKETTNISNFNLKNSFHLMLYGLDAEKMTNNELIEEIYSELKNKVGKIEMDDILILDENSVINYVVQNIPNFSDYDKFLQFGRFAVIRMKNEKDALKLLTHKVNINLCLTQSRRGMPLMNAGNALVKFIEKSQ